MDDSNMDVKKCNLRNKQTKRKIFLGGKGQIMETLVFFELFLELIAVSQGMVRNILGVIRS